MSQRHTLLQRRGKPRKLRIRGLRLRTTLSGFRVRGERVFSLFSLCKRRQLKAVFLVLCQSCVPHRLRHLRRLLREILLQQWSESSSDGACLVQKNVLTSDGLAEMRPRSGQLSAELGRVAVGVYHVVVAAS